MENQTVTITLTITSIFHNKLQLRNWTQPWRGTLCADNGLGVATMHRKSIAFRPYQTCWVLLTNCEPCVDDAENIGVFLTWIRCFYSGVTGIPCHVTRSQDGTTAGQDPAEPARQECYPAFLCTLHTRQ